MKKGFKLLTSLLLVFVITLALVGCTLGESDITKISVDQTEHKIGLGKEKEIQLNVLGVDHKDKIKVAVEKADIVEAKIGEKDLLTVKGLKEGDSKITLTPTKKTTEKVELVLNITVEDPKPITAIADVDPIALDGLVRSKTVDLVITPENFNEAIKVEVADQKLTATVVGTKLTVTTATGGYDTTVTISGVDSKITKTIQVNVAKFVTADLVALPETLEAKVGETPMELLKVLPMDHVDELTVVSSVPAVATANIVLKNTLRVEALTEGETTLTITSADNPELKKEIKLTVGAADTVEACVGVTDTEVVVGNTAATTGPYAGVGVPFNAGIEAVFKEINALGGVNGRTIKFIHNDDGANTTNGTTYVTEMLDKAFAIVGNFGGTVEPTIPIISGQNKIMFYAANGTNAMYNEDAQDGHKGIFAVQPVSMMDGRFMLARAITTKAYGTLENPTKLEADARIGVISTSAQGELEIVAGIKLEAKYRNIAEDRLIIKEINMNDTQNITSAVNDLKAKGVKVVLLPNSQPTFKAIMPILIDSELNVPVFTSYFNADASVFGDKVIKFRVFANSWIDLASASAAFELQEYIQFLARTNNMTYATNAFFSAGYIAGTMFVQALARTGRNVTTASFIAAQEAVKEINIPLGGVVVVKDAEGKSRRVGTEQLGMVEFKDATRSLSGVPAYEKAAELEKIDDLK